MSELARAIDGTYPTTCWECSTCCGALATVRDGHVAEFGPNRSHPYSKGAFCIKGIRGAPGITYSGNQLLYPMRRTGARGDGKWARISWDDALDEMADRLAAVRQAYGPEAIVGATSGAYFSRSVILALTLRSIGSPNWMINQDLCGGCRAVSARVTGLDITRGEDIDNTRCALVVGRNPSIADPVEWAALKAAKKRGARIIVVDPKRTPAAQMADVWLAPRISTDAALALAMTHVLISEGLYDRGFVTRWCHGFDELARRGGRGPAGYGGGLHGGAGGPDRGRSAPVCGWPVDLRERPRHRCVQRRRADLPRLSLPGRHQRQCRPARRQPAHAHAQGLPHLRRASAHAGVQAR
jgi:thiosulfate reductase/polysulfide reductase chain A